MAKQRTDTESVLKLVINNEQAKTSIKELRDTYFKLNTEITNMKREDDPRLYDQKANAIRKVKEAWNEARNEINGSTKEVSGFRSSLADLAKDAIGPLSIATAFYAVTNGIKTAIQKNAELSDAFANVQKTTGLTEEAVDRLNEKFKKMDTRTASNDLLGLAEVAGKLGYSSERDVEGFVRAADKIGVALGEDLGGVEESVNSLGKLVNIFKLSDEFELEEALLKVGSAINTLGAEGTAAEKNLIDFAQRLAGVAPAANISLPTVLAYGAVMDELGQSMESSSTAIGQFIVGIGADIPKYAKIAEMSIDDFSKLLNSDANAALLKVLENSKTAGGGIQALATNMGILEVSGGRGIAALGAMADNIDLVRTRMDTAKISFDEGTSVIDEFNVKNSNLAANLEKIWNNIDQLWQNSTFRDWMTTITGVMADGRGEAQRLTDEYDAQRTSLEDLENQINPLKDRYDELKGKTTLNKDEQVELKTVINQIATLLPESATEWNKYGEALDINRTKVESMTFAQRELFQLRNAETIAELKDVFSNYSGISEQYTKAANDTQKRINSDSSGGFLSLFGIDKKGLWKKDLSEFNAQSKLAMGEAYDAAVKLRDFGQTLTPQQQAVIDHFEAVEKAAKKVKNAVDPKNEPGTKPTGKPDKKADSEAKREQERIKRTEDRQKEHLANLLREEGIFSVQQLIDQKSTNDAEVAQLELDYQKKIDKFKDFIAKTKGLEAEKAIASSKIKELEASRDQGVADLKLKQEKELTESILKVRGDLSARSQTEYDKEAARINNHFDKLHADAGTNAAQTAIIEEGRAAALSDAKIREEERLLKVKKAIEDEASAYSTNKWEQKKNEVKQQYDREIALLKERNTKEIQESEAFKEVVKAYEINKNKELYQIEEDRRKTLKDLAIDAAQNIANATFSIISNNIKSESDAKIAAIQQQREKELSQRNLTEKQKQAINEKYDKLEKAEKLRAWKAQKKADILSATIATALAVTKALPNWILAAAAGIAGAAQIAVIASQKPPQFAKGGFVPKGSSHAQGGINLIDSRSGVVTGNVEGGEPILSKNTYANNREVVDALLYNSQRRNGAAIQVTQNAIDAERAVRYAGMTSGPGPQSNNTQVNVPEADNSEVVQLLRLLVNKKSDVVLSNRLWMDHQEDNIRIENKVNA